MKLRKILAAVAAMAMSTTIFSSVAMADEGIYGTPEITVNFVQSGNYLDLEIGYKGFEGFTEYVSDRSGISGIGVAAITLKFAYDENEITYDGGQKNISVGSTIISASGVNPAVYAGAYSGDAVQTSTENSKIATLWFTLPEGFDATTDSVDFKLEEIELTIKDFSGTNADVIYGNTNISTVAMEPVTFTYGATTPVVDTAVAGNDMYGQKTFLTKFETSNNVADPNVVIAKGDESKTYGSENFPSGVVGGTMKLIAIVRYAAEAAVAGDVFTVTLNDGTTALGSTTYTVPAAE